MFNKIIRIFAVLLIGFAGGAMTPWVLGWIKNPQISSAPDAVSIANTYIVFTTIIFVGVTVILAVAGYVFTQQFSATKSAQEHQILDELKEKIKTDEELGIRLANSVLENSDVKRHLERVLTSKLDQLLEATVSGAYEAAEQFEATAAAAKDQAQGLASLRAHLNGNGRGEGK